jgi:tRNA(fMet)-specific endonuclease VapC
LIAPLYLLDTNILSDAIRNPYGRSQSYMKRFDQSLICTSAIVASEMRYGIAKRHSPQLTERVELILNWINVLPYDDEASRRYGLIRSTLEGQGQAIGWGDLFIAAHASAHNLTLVTNNVREFSRIEKLKLENWLEEPS